MHKSTNNRMKPRQLLNGKRFSVYLEASHLELVRVWADEHCYGNNSQALRQMLSIVASVYSKEISLLKYS